MTAGFALSTCQNYTRALSQISLYFNQTFTTLTDKQIADYAYHLRHIGRSQSVIKFLMFGYGFWFKTISSNRKLPYIGSKKKSRLPVVLSQSEVKVLLQPKHCPNLKHRLIIALIYSCGLRISELLKLKVEHIDFDAERIYIEKSKGGISRYVVLSKLIEKGIKQHLQENNPGTFLIEGYEKDKPYSSNSVRIIFKNTLQRAGLKKKLTLHDLRHTYAVHTLEQGGNILQLKELLGHSSLKSTLLYLRICNANFTKVHSPLDVLYGIE